MSDEPGLHAQIVVRRGAFTLDAVVDSAAHHVVAVVGPNGAGKTTLLRCLSGLLPLDRGRIEVAGRVLEDTATGVRVPAQERACGVVFQDQLLFPHLSVLDNIAFGLQARGIGRRQARESATGWLDRLGIGELSARRPGGLSGGQAQRVALARALVGGPALLVLDEPTAAVDVEGRGQLRALLREHLGAFTGTTVLVTHDPVEALVLADQVVVLHDGAVEQAGPPGEVAAHPRTPFVARLVGLNLLPGTAGRDVVQLDDGGRLVTVSAPDGPVLVAVSPSAVAVHRERPRGSPRNIWPARLVSAEPTGSVVRLDLVGRPSVLADVTPAALAELALVPGDEAWLSVKATELVVYAAGP